GESWIFFLSISALISGQPSTLPTVQSLSEPGCWSSRFFSPGLPGRKRRPSFVLSADGLRRPIQLAIDIRIPPNRLHLLPRFGERDGLDKFLNVAIFPVRLPVHDSIIACIVGGQRVFETAKLIHHRAEILRTELQVDSRGKELLSREVFQFLLFGDASSHFG